MRTLILLSCMFCAIVTAAAQEITIAAASDLNYALREIARRYEATTGSRVRLSFGSSGNLYGAIQNGAPYDVFFSADADYPRKLEAEGLTVPGTLYSYAEGRLVLWVPNESKLDVRKGIGVLTGASVRKIAIANPRHAPYGRAAVAALRSAGIYEAVAGKFVLGENISQTAQFVQTGNADAGLIALSLALAPNMAGAGKYFLLPAASYPPIEQAAVILQSAKNKPEARQFLDFVKGSVAADIMKRYGFRRPEVNAAPAR